LKNTDILIINKEESLLLTNKLSIKESLEVLSNYINGIVVVTDGKMPIHAFDGKKLFIKKIISLKPLNTTGAGDAFSAGFVYGIIKGKNIDGALSFGHKEAYSVLMHQGAKTGLLRKI